MVRPKLKGRKNAPWRPRVEELESRLVPATFVVNDLGDSPIDFGDSNVTLREAIAAANADVQVAPSGPTGNGADVITFADHLFDSGPGTIALQEPLGTLEITGALTITGPGSALLTITGGREVRVFTVADGVTSRFDATIEEMTLTRGWAERGGAVYTSENLTLRNLIISDSWATDLGGGIFNDFGGVLDLTNVAVTGNTAQRFGGGIFNGNSSLTVAHSTIAHNLGMLFGGGLFSDYGGTASIAHSSISYNQTNKTINHTGGGIFNGVSSMTIIGSTIDHNGAYNGGGINNSGGNVVVVNSTFSSNVAPNDGGGVYIHSGSFKIINSTITANHADDDNNNIGEGGGIFRTGGTVEIDNTIVAGNFRRVSAPVVQDIRYNVLAHYSLIGSTSGWIVVAGSGNNVTGVSAATVLEPTLTSNGGPTLTHALVDSGSNPALNAGSDALAVDSDTSPLVIDQRGFDRFIGVVDIGAVEYGPPGVSIVTVDDTAAESPPGDTAVFRVSRTGATGAALTVNLTIAAGSTAHASDYTLSGGSVDVDGSNVTVTLGSGAAFIDLVVAAVDDLDPEPAETLTLNLAAGSYQVNSFNNSATVTIRESELSPPEVSLATIDATAAESPAGNTGGFRISRSGATDDPLTVNLTIAAGSTAAAADYSLSGGSVVVDGSNVTVVLGIGQSSIDLVVTAVNDDAEEGDETLTLELAAGAYVIDATNQTGTVSILPNDTPPPPKPSPLPPLPDALAGNQDFVIVGASGSPTDILSVKIFDGGGNLVNSVQPFNHLTSLRVAAGDFDGDGRVDEFAVLGRVQSDNPDTNFRARIVIYDLDAAGNATETARFFAFVPGILGNGFIAAGDFDGDGDDDLSVAHIGGGRVVVTVQNFIAAGDGSFQVGGSILVDYRTVAAPRIAAGDVDGDGFDEIVVVARTNAGADVRILHANNPDLVPQEIGGFVWDFGIAGYARGAFVAVGEFDPTVAGEEIVLGSNVGGDGRVDVLGYNFEPNTAELAENGRLTPFGADYEGAVRVAAGRLDDRVVLVAGHDRYQNGQYTIMAREVNTGQVNPAFESIPPVTALTADDGAAPSPFPGDSGILGPFVAFANLTLPNNVSSLLGAAVPGDGASDDIELAIAMDRYRSRIDSDELDAFFTEL